MSRSHNNIKLFYRCESKGNLDHNWPHPLLWMSMPLNASWCRRCVGPFQVNWLLCCHTQSLFLYRDLGPNCRSEGRSIVCFIGWFVLNKIPLGGGPLWNTIESLNRPSRSIVWTRFVQQDKKLYRIGRLATSIVCVQDRRPTKSWV